MGKTHEDDPTSQNMTNGAGPSSKKGNKKKNAAENVDHQLDFGNLNEQMQPHIERLRSATTSMDAMSNLFSQHKSDLAKFTEESKKLKDMKVELNDYKRSLRLLRENESEEIMKLRAEIDLFHEERETMHKEREDLKSRRAKQDQEYSKRANKIIDDGKRLKESMQMDLEAEKEAWNASNGTKLTNLQSKNKQLSSEKADIQAELEKLREVHEKDRKDYMDMRDHRDHKITELKQDLDKCKRALAVEGRSDDYYMKRFQEIQHAVFDVAEQYFPTPLSNTNFLKNQSPDSQGLLEQMVEFASLSEPKISTNSRNSLIEFIILDTIRTEVFQPFVIGASSKQRKVSTVFQRMSEELYPRDKRAESVWRALTVTACERTQQEEFAPESVTKVIMRNLERWTGQTGEQSLATALNEVVANCIAVWCVSQKDADQLLVIDQPNSMEDTGWIKEFHNPQNDSSDRGDGIPQQAQDMSPLCIFPKIVRKKVLDQGSQRMVIKGRAIFATSNLIVEGRKEVAEVRQLWLETQRQRAAQSQGDGNLPSPSDRRLSLGAQF